MAVGEVRYVKFEVRSNHGDRRYVGLSRVQFFGREEVEGVTVKEVSSGQAFDPKNDPERAEAYPALEAVPAGGDTFDVTIRKRGSYDKTCKHKNHSFFYGIWDNMVYALDYLTF